MEQAMRDEFEAWWNLPAQSELRKSCARGWAELIWKASRAALRVELPKSDYADQLDGDAYVMESRAVAKALQQAGIEVKP
ncbi:TPA: hypothetical protein NH527_005809 [Pseudomonas aeruginosa]|uniref:hypothetical protein n=1 Tax=Pseudomonas aeruginosa TaxID=287 RepID=UPI0029906A65|nr:hypothetical protein [Pseudomonas aeruginosa]MDW8831468.1 hypothetical protein [Pseudomonas aeruginosa]HBP4991327.1 hypothetical protein [Pseudomonas aeruginosa]HCE9937178.1 hypothetical protein [Pseudomonas aeruginosa]